MRLLDRADVVAAGGDDVVNAMEVIRHALAELRSGRAEMPPENSVSLGADGRARAYALPARVGDAAGVKWTAHRPEGHVPSIASFTMVNDAVTGLPLGLVESALLTATRTAATSAFMLMARPPRRVALLGAGVQARAHLRMLSALFPDLDAVTIWNRTAARAHALASVDAPFPLDVCSSAEAALDQADTVITCTNAAAPILDSDAVQPGRTILQVGYHEVSFEAIERADQIVVDLWGEFRMTSAKSIFQMHRAGRFNARRVDADLASLALDRWRPGTGASVFFSSFGLNVFDVAIAANVLRLAKSQDIGLLWNPRPGATLGSALSEEGPGAPE